jgi:hypothetical protein
VALLQREHVEKMLAEIEKTSAKRHWLKAIRGLMQAAVPTMRKDNPTADIPSVKLAKSKGHHTWTDAEIKQYRGYWPLGTQQRHVFEFALETVSRRGEVVRRGGSTSKAGAFGSSARMAAPMWTFRSRPSCKRPAMLCQRHT